MFYLASPYSAPDNNIVQTRVHQTSECFANLCKKGLVVFSPILMCHETAVNFTLPTDAKYWQRMNTQFLKRCDAMYVLCIPGWARSSGVTQEIKLAKQLDMSIYYITVEGKLISENKLPA